jgi:hypothetical protein
MRQTQRNHTKVGAGLWIVQGLLALLFLFAGGMKLVMPIELLTEQMPLPELFVRFIGVAETLGALGLVLPGIFRIRPALTPLAAGGLVLIMCGAIGTTITLMDFSQATVPFVVGLLAAGVCYGRTQVAPHREAARFTLRLPSRGIGRVAVAAS